MLEHLSYGQVNPQHVMGQLGNPLLGGVGSFGINPQLVGLGGIGGVNPTFGTPTIDPVTAAYIQQQLVQQALLGSISPWGQTPYGLATVLGQSSPFGVGSPYGPATAGSIFGQQSSGFGQASPWSHILGQTQGYGNPLGQMSPYSQNFGQNPFTQVSPYSQVSPYGQVSPYTQVSPWSQIQSQNPLLTHMQAAIAAQQLIPQLTQQQFGRVPYGSPFTQQLGGTGISRGASPFTQGVSPFTQGVSPFTQGVSPFTQNVGLGTSPFLGSY